MENSNFVKTGEKNEVRRIANIAGAASASMFIFNTLLQFTVVMVLYILGMNTVEQKEFLSNNVVNLALQAVLPALIFTLPFIFSAKIGGERPSELIALKKPEKGTVLPLIFIGLAICEIAEMLTMRFLTTLQDFSFKPEFDLGFSYDTDPFSIALAVLSVAVIPALVEEFAMRGVLLGLFRRFGDGFAIVVSAIVFGLGHGNLVQIPFAFIVGLGLGFITVKSGSIVPACIVHFINNFTSVLMEYVAKSDSTLLLSVTRVGIGTVWLVLGVIGIIMLSGREKAFSFDKPEMEATFRDKLKWTFTSPLFVTAVVIMLVRLITK